MARFALIREYILSELRGLESRGVTKAELWGSFPTWVDRVVETMADLRAQGRPSPFSAEVTGSWKGMGSDSGIAKELTALHKAGILKRRKEAFLFKREAYVQAYERAGRSISVSIPEQEHMVIEYRYYLPEFAPADAG